MKTFIEKLIQLADGLDGLGMNKEADLLDTIVAKTAAGEDFEDYLKLFDEPVALDDTEEKGPVEERVVLDGPDVHTPLEEEEAPLSTDRKNRLKLLKRRHEELSNLKHMLQKSKAKEELEDAEEVMPSDEVKLPIATPEELSFEDEDDEDEAVNQAADIDLDAPDFDDLEPELKKEWEALQAARGMGQEEEIEEVMNDADDEGMIGKLKQMLKGAPELAKQLLQLVKDNPELLELLAL